MNWAMYFKVFSVSNEQFNNTYSYSVIIYMKASSDSQLKSSKFSVLLLFRVTFYIHTQRLKSLSFFWGQIKD